MSNRFSLTTVLALALRTFLLCLAAVVISHVSLAHACIARVDLPAIESVMAQPGLDPALLRDARDLRGKAAKAIQDGRAAEGNQLYRDLMALLLIQTSSSKARC